MKEKIKEEVLNVKTKEALIDWFIDMLELESLCKRRDRKSFRVL